VLDYDFTKNSQFAAKTDRNSVFLWRDPHILDREYLMVPYMSFYRFLKNSNFHSKYVGVSINYTENRQFRAKTNRNSVFLGCDSHIIDWLYITIPYMNFYRFWKNSIFRSKSIGVSLRFYRKSLVWGINWPKLSISWSQSPYCGSVIDNGPVYVFLYVLKKLKFLLKICRC
jgi:hypothetical protein